MAEAIDNTTVLLDLDHAMTALGKRIGQAEAEDCATHLLQAIEEATDSDDLKALARALTSLEAWPHDHYFELLRQPTCPPGVQEAIVKKLAERAVQTPEELGLRVEPPTLSDDEFELNRWTFAAWAEARG